jgi:hypothetical protein
MGQKRARILAAVAILASAIGAAWAAAVFQPKPGGGNSVWYVTPVLLSAVVFMTVGRRSIGGVWVPIGATLGFVLIGLWSIGFFFAPAALLLLATGATHVAYVSAIRPQWRVLLIPLWVLVGASGMCVVFLTCHQVQSFGRGSEAPFIIEGTGVFVVLVSLIGLASLIQSLLTKFGASR